MTASPFDPREFRRALGSFATGVAIITARTSEGAPMGLTVNSFNSVSLNPPMVLWSLANNALSLPAFRAAKHWAVHVLAADQEALSARFARRGLDKFAGLSLEDGHAGLPLLTGCAARFQCKAAFQYEGGDHVIFVGEVIAFDRSGAPPLVFHGGSYAHATRRDPAAPKPRDAYLAGSFSEDFVGYLLGRSHFRFLAQIRPYLERESLTDQDFYVLSTLTLKRSVSAQELARGMAGVLDDHAGDAVRSLVERGLAQEMPAVAEIDSAEYMLTARGRDTALRLISEAKGVESQLIEKLGAGEAAALKTLLNRLLDVLDPDAAALWGNQPKLGAQFWPPE